MERSQRTKLGILFGGRSGEHEVSLASAASVIQALDPAEYQITAIGITKGGMLATASEIRAMLPAEVQPLMEPYDSLQARDSRMRLVSGSEDGARSPSPPEIIFPLLHGPYGEDGTIQGLLEIAGLPYVGCGVLASAAGMDKDVAKRLFIQEGLPVPGYKVVFSRDVSARTNELQREVEDGFGYPVFSKPANLGSSVGVRKIHSGEEFAEAVQYSAQFDRKILIEQGIDARELECAVLGNDEPRASIVGEVIPANEFYDYEAKYVKAESRLEIPARITEAQSEEIRRIALQAFRALDGSGLARVDFFMDRKTGKVWLNEINTMPGFTPISMYSKLWASSGIPFRELVRKLVQLGFERYRERSGFRVSPQWDLP